MNDYCIVLTQTGGFWLIDNIRQPEEKVFSEYVEYLNEGNEPVSLTKPLGVQHDES